MKRVAGILMLALASTMIFSADGFSQKKKAKRRTVNTKRKPTTAVEPAPELPAAPVEDSPEKKDSLIRAGMIPKPLVAMRPGTTVIGNLVAEKTPLEYDHLRIDDQVYKQVLLKDISIFEKMNTTFRYAGEDDNGSQAFFFILLQHIRDGDITAFDAVNERFTTILPIAKISEAMSGGCQTIQVPDMVADPDGTKGLMRDTLICEEFNINTVVGYRIKEEVIFDRETSRMHFRTLGIAPLKEKDIVGQKAMIPMFWIYYPDARPFLAKHEAYNPINLAMPKSWESIFEDRYYSSTIYKSTMNNYNDYPLGAIVKDPLMRLFEGENIKDKIFNWEQDQWSY